MALTPKDGPEGVGVGEATLRTWKWEDWPCLCSSLQGELARKTQAKSTWW